MASSSCGKPGGSRDGGRYALAAGHGLLTAVASLLQNTGSGALRLRQLQHVGSTAEACRLNICGTWASLLCGVWNLPRPGIDPMSPALAGMFWTTREAPALKFY